MSVLPRAVHGPLRDAIVGIAVDLKIILMDHFEENLDAISSASGTLRDRAHDVLIWADKGGRQRTELLLEALYSKYGRNLAMIAAINACRAHLKNVAADLATALAVRRIRGQVFANREDLRRYILTEFSSDSHPYRVVVVDGEAHTGKTYLWSFVNYAAGSLGVDAVMIDLETEGDITARDLFDLIVDQSARAAPQERAVDPTATPERQAKSLVTKLVGWHKKGEVSGERPLWIVLDHLDKVWPPDPSSGVTQFIQHLALATAQRKVEGLRLILLGAPVEAVGGRLEIELQRQTIDRLTTGDLTEWLRDELGDLNLDVARLDSEAATVLDGEPRRLHQRLDSRCQQLRGQHGGGR